MQNYSNIRQPLKAGQAIKRARQLPIKPKGWILLRQSPKIWRRQKQLSWIQQIPTESCQSCLAAQRDVDIYIEKHFWATNRRKLLKLFPDRLAPQRHCYKKRFDKKWVRFDTISNAKNFSFLTPFKLISVFTRMFRLLTCKGYPVSENHRVSLAMWVPVCNVCIHQASDWLAKAKGQCTTWHCAGGIL